MSNTPLHIPKLIEMGKWIDYRKDIWGDSFNWSWNRRSDEVRYLVIHHTVTKHEATPDDIALLHKARGWAGIGYHFVITKDGTVYYCGDVGTARANVLNKNEQVIGITLVGDFTKHNPSDEQIVSAHELCKFFLFSAPSFPNIKSWDDVVGHKELQATACPGTYWKGVPDSIYNRIVNRIPYTPVDPEPTPPVDPTDPCAETKAENERLKSDLITLEQKLAVKPTEIVVERIVEVPVEVIKEKVVTVEKQVEVYPELDKTKAPILISALLKSLLEARW